MHADLPLPACTFADQLTDLGRRQEEDRTVGGRWDSDLAVMLDPSLSSLEVA